MKPGQLQIIKAAIDKSQKEQPDEANYLLAMTALQIVDEVTDNIEAQAKAMTRAADALQEVVMQLDRIATVMEKR